MTKRIEINRDYSYIIKAADEYRRRQDNLPINDRGCAPRKEWRDASMRQVAEDFGIPKSTLAWFIAKKYGSLRS